jgi:hypothetical protein
VAVAGGEREALIEPHRHDIQEAHPADPPDFAAHAGTFLR